MPWKADLAKVKFMIINTTINVMKSISGKRLLIFLLLIVCQINLSGIEPALKGEPVKIKVLCYNLRFGELATLEELASFIDSIHPDVVALQEVDVRTFRDRAKHQNGKDFITELAFRTGMLSAYGRTIDYAGGYYGIGILSRFPISETRRVMLPMPEGAKEQRALLLAGIELPGGKGFTFVSTHLDHSSSVVRKVQVKALNRALSGIRSPVVVAGDFNAKPDSPEIAVGMRKWRTACTNDFTISSSNPTSKIDYIFFAPAGRWRKTDAATPKVTLSDHLPLWAELELLF